LRKRHLSLREKRNSQHHERKYRGTNALRKTWRMKWRTRGTRCIFARHTARTLRASANSALYRFMDSSSNKIYQHHRKSAEAII